MVQMQMFLFSSLLISLAALGSVSHVLAVAGAEMIIEPRIVEAYAGQKFTIEVWIRNLSSDMTKFSFKIDWNTALMEYVSHTNHVSANGWSIPFAGEEVDAVNGEYALNAEGPAFGADASWVTITFRCLGESSSPINIVESSIWKGEEFFDVTDLKAAVNQNPDATVGGITTPINKLLILTPYLAFAGLIAVISTVYVIGKRKD